MDPEDAVTKGAYQNKNFLPPHHDLGTLQNLPIRKSRLYFEPRRVDSWCTAISYFRLTSGSHGIEWIITNHIVHPIYNISLESVLASRAMYTMNNSPEFDSYHRGGTTLMCRLVIGTPSSDDIANVAAAVLDLSVVTHGVSSDTILGE